MEDIGEVEFGDPGADNAPMVRLVSSILQQAVAESVSDIHVEPRARSLRTQAVRQARSQEMEGE